jgi:hypothetical protein
MVRIEKSLLIIELPHPSPEDFLMDLKKSIIEVIQNQSGKALDLTDLCFTNYTLLELFKGLEYREAPERPIRKKERKRNSLLGGQSIIPPILPDLP